MQFVADHHFNVGFDDSTLVKQVIRCNIINFFTYKKILLIFYFSAKILKILSKLFFFLFFPKLCFPSDFVVFVQGSRQGTLTHLVINMCTSILAFHRRFPCSQPLLLQGFSPSRTYFYGSVQSSVWRTKKKKKNVILLKSIASYANVFVASHFHSRLKKKKKFIED